jgi:hypothetical protein
MTGPEIVAVSDRYRYRIYNLTRIAIRQVLSGSTRGATTRLSGGQPALDQLETAQGVLCW